MTSIHSLQGSSLDFEKAEYVLNAIKIFILLCILCNFYFLALLTIRGIICVSAPFILQYLLNVSIIATLSK